VRRTINIRHFASQLEKVANMRIFKLDATLPSDFPALKTAVWYEVLCVMLVRQISTCTLCRGHKHKEDYQSNSM
jgi:hypothetical protein